MSAAGDADSGGGSSTPVAVARGALSPATEPPVSFGAALRFWAKLGWISFGGPAGQIAIMHRELVDQRRWISDERFLHALSYCMLLPGPEAQQLATYVGWLLHRTRGGIVAGVLFVLPSVFLLLALSWIYAAFGTVPAVAGVLRGFEPVVVAIIGEAVLRIGRRALRGRIHVAIAASSFVAIYALGVPFPVIVFGAAAVGLAVARWWPGALSEAAPVTSERGALDGGDGLPSRHAEPSTGRALRVLAVCFALWALPYGLIVGALGAGSLQAAAYRFFTQAAFVTFGGAYAVLAYVTQVAVERYEWLSGGQAMVGLALAETTPGPLIMVLQFVGFMAGWNQGGAELPRLANAVTTALATTWATFLPCFLFIFLGAPYIERLRGNRHLSTALAFVTAAVVGVVLNLGVVFGSHVLFPGGSGAGGLVGAGVAGVGLVAGTDLVAAVAAVLAFLALERWHWNVVLVIAAGGALGLLRLAAGV